MNLFFLRKPTPAPQIIVALQQLISRRKLAKLTLGLEPAFILEHLSRSLDLDTEKLLQHVANFLSLPIKTSLVAPSLEIVQRTGFSKEQLQDWYVVPQPSERPSGYELVIADPDLVSIQEFEACGVTVCLSIASTIAASWEVFDSLQHLSYLDEAVSPISSQEETAPENASLSVVQENDAQGKNNHTPNDLQSENEVGDHTEQLFPILSDLVTECRNYGAESVRVLNGSRCCYEFEAENIFYSGPIHPELLAKIQLALQPTPLLSFRPQCDDLKVIFLEKEQDKTYRLYWHSDSETPPSSGQVLIVDDDERFTYLLATLLRNRNYEVLSYRSSREALQKLLQNDLTPDLIISDVHMPEMDGGGFLAALRHAGEKTPVLILTSDDDVTLEAEMATLGAHAFLQKREDPRILLAWVQNLLER